MKSHWVYYVLLALGVFSCASQGRIVTQGDEYDDVYFVEMDAKKAKVRQNQKILEDGGLTADAYNADYDQKPISNFANPDALDYPVSQGGSLYTPISSQSNNWKNYNSWNNTNCWNCNSWGWGVGCNSWNNPCWYATWNSPCYWNTWNTWNDPFWYRNSWSNPYWNVGWGSGWSVGYGWGWNYWGWNNWNNTWANNPWVWSDNRPVVVGAPRASAGRGNSFIRNTPNPRLQNNTNINESNNNNDNNQGGRIISGGRTRNYSSNTYNPTESNEIRTGRIKVESNNSSSERYNRNSERYRGDSESNRNSWFGRSNSNFENSSSWGSGRERTSSSSSFSSGRSGGSSGGTRTGGRSGR
ncbi:MAG: hypothetical protein NZ516_01035 [Raineya sp.]|nr:hypothetical protein [Raineya sp.]